MLLKNTCERVYLLVKLLAISLQACKFTKNEILQIYFSRILDFKLLIIVLESQKHLFFKVPFNVGLCQYLYNSQTCIFNLLEKCFSFLQFILTHSYHTTLVTD